MNYIGTMKTQRIIAPPKPTRPLRQSLRRNTVKGDSNSDAVAAKYGYVIVGTRKLPVRKPETSHSAAAGAATMPNANLNASRPSEPNPEIIEDLFREARSGKFDTFSRRLKGVIKQYLTLAEPNVGKSSTAAVTEAITDPLANARLRGKQYALAEWQKPENLTLQAAADYAGMSDSTINTRRQNQHIYALVAPNRSRGYRYPQWQFDVDPERVRTAIQVFTDAGRDNCWILHNFFLVPTPELDDMRPCDYLADPSKDMQRLIQVMQRRFVIGDQGAA